MPDRVRTQQGDFGAFNAAGGKVGIEIPPAEPHELPQFVIRHAALCYQPPYEAFTHVEVLGSLRNREGAVFDVTFWQGMFPFTRCVFHLS